MTENKSIIIDGLNLEYIKELLYNGQRSAITTNIFEAIIEELERKEQECEKIKNWVKGMMFYTDCSNWFERFTTAFEDWKNDLTSQLDQLKAEKEILEAHSATLDAVIETGRVQYKSLKQTLTDIKEMLKEICMEECSFDWNKTSKKHCGDCDCRYGQILQKIRECEVENERN